MRHPRLKRRDSLRGLLLFEHLEARIVLASDWQNPIESLDTDTDGLIAPLDALVVINELNGVGPRALTGQPDAVTPYLDVSGDQFLSPLDALIVINHVNTEGSGPVPGILLESAATLHIEETLPIPAGTGVGTRQLLVDVQKLLSPIQPNLLTRDLFAVYIVDKNNPGTTLIDGGIAGSPVFTISRDSTEFVPGISSWNGQTLQVDVSALGQNANAVLKAQLINGDGIVRSMIRLSDLRFEADSDATANPLTTPAPVEAVPGPAVDTSQYTVVPDIGILLSNAQYDAGSGAYRAHLALDNQGVAIGRQAIVTIEGLPNGATILNASGSTASQLPYLNFTPAIAGAGLEESTQTSDLVLRISNPNNAPLVLRGKVLAGVPNSAPSLPTIPELTVTVGDRIEFDLAAQDIDGDFLAYALTNAQAEPANTLLGGAYLADGKLIIAPLPADLGTYDLELSASDGLLTSTQLIRLNVQSDPVQSTRVTGRVLDVDGTPIAGIRVEIGSSQALTQADGAFLIDVGSGVPASDTLRVRGELLGGSATYPFIAEKLALLLERGLVQRVNNIIYRPIYLPKLDVANGKTIDPTRVTVVTTPAIPLASVTIAAGTLMNQQGTPFTGQLSITEVPTAFTPASLPNGMVPDLVVTIQPGEMVLTTPAPLSLPNRSGLAPGVKLDLWSINPVTGQFTVVGVGQVSVDGRSITTISGGIRNSSWHFFSLLAGTPFFDDFNLKQGCTCPSGPPAATTTNSQTVLFTGDLKEEHYLVPYESLGQTRGLSVHYNSGRLANDRWFFFRFPSLDSSGQAVSTGGGVVQTRISGSFDVLQNGKVVAVSTKFNDLIDLTQGTATQSILAGKPFGKYIKIPTASLRTGAYTGQLSVSIDTYVNGVLASRSPAPPQTIDFLNFNTRKSVFGAGWELGGLQRIYVSDNEPLILSDGNGLELIYQRTGGATFQSSPGDFSTLRELPSGGYRRTLLDQSTFDFDSDGRLISVKDRLGNTTAYTYELIGNGVRALTSITDPVGLTTTIQYSQGLMSSVTDPFGRVTHFAHDTSRNLVGITDPDGTSRAFTYDGQNRMRTEHNKRGLDESTTYDINGRVRQATRKDGTEITVVPAQANYNLGTPTATVYDANGKPTVYTLNRQGQVVTVSDSLGTISTVQRDSLGQVTRSTDGRGNTVDYRYDSRGNLTETLESVRFFAVDHFSTGYADGDALGQSGGEGWGGAWRDFTGGTGTDRQLSVDLRYPGIASEPGGLSTNQFTGSFGSTSISRKIALPTEGTLYVGVLMNIQEDASGADGTMLFLLDNVIFGDAYTSGNSLSLVARNTGQPFSFSTQTVANTGILFDFSTTYYLVVRIDFDTEGPNSITKGVNDRLQLYVNPAPGIEPSKPDAVITGKDVGTSGAIGLWAQKRAAIDELHVGTRFSDMFDADAMGPDELLLPSQAVDESEPRAVALANVSGDANLDLLLQGSGGAIDLKTGIGQGAFDESLPFLPATSSHSTWDGASGQLPSVLTPLPMPLVNDNFAAANPSVSPAGILSLDTMAQANNALFGYRISDSSLVYPTQTVVNFRMKLVDQVTTANNRSGAAVVLATKNNIGGVLQIGADEIFLLAPNDVRGPVAAVDTNDDFHDYRIELDGIESGKAIRVYQDGVLKLASTLFQNTSLFGTSPSLAFGELSQLARGASEWSHFEHNVMAGPSFVRVGDVAGSSLPDVIAATIPGNTLTVNLALSEGGFQTSQWLVPNNPTWAEIGDVNRDQRSDIVTFSPASRKLAVLLADAAGGFLPFREQVLPAVSGGYASRFQLADLNSDGNLDFVILSGSSAVALYFGDGAGNFPTSSTLTVAGTAKDIAIADLNGDQKLDLVISRSTSNVVSTWLNAGNATFPTKIDTPSSAPAQIAIADLNGDGKGDLLAVHPVSNLLETRFGLGNGNFGAAQNFATGLNPARLLTADMDLDGDADVMIGNTTATRWIVSTNQTFNPLPFVPEISLLQRSFTYESHFNQLTSMTDELGRQTLLDIDPANGNTRKITRVVGHVDDGNNGETDDLVVHFTYTTAGLVDTITDPLGRVTDFEYDVWGRLITQSLAVGTPTQAVRRWEYDAVGNVTARIDENGHRTAFQYDVMNRVKRITEADPDGPGPLQSPITTLGYDANGNVVSLTDPQGNVTKTEYDSMDRVTRIVDERDQATLYKYDSKGNVVRVTDPLGKTTVNSYDSRDRLQYMIDPDGGLTRFGYDRNNNLTRITDPVNNVTKFEYDFRDRAISETDPLGKQIRYAYDGVNNLVRKTDRLNRVTEFQYDELNRLANERWRDAGRNLTNRIDYHYDKAGNLLAVDDFFSALEMGYDSLDRVTTVDNAGTPGAPHVVLNYTYDALGNVLSVADTIDGTPGAITSYAYDALDRTTRVTQSGLAGSSVSDKRVDFAYNAVGQYQSVNRYSDLAGTQLVVGTTYQYDDLNRLTDLRHRNSTGDVAFYTYAYDAASRITSIADIDGLTTYSYDQRDQLVGANHTDPNQPDETYAYDANGNRVSSHLHGNGYVTGPANRLLSDGTYNYAYDAEGNMLRRTEIATGAHREFTWDNRNRLIRVIDSSSGGIATQDVAFTYDALGRRLSKSVDTTPGMPDDSTVTHFVYDREDVLLDFIDGDGADDNPDTPLGRYLHGSGFDQVLMHEGASPNVRWLLTDQMGTVRDITDNIGSVHSHIQYDTFGTTVSQSGTAADSRFLFSTREFDQETDLYFYRARYYAADMGRWVNEDPLRTSAGDVNLFRFVGNSPNNRVDPTGLAWWNPWSWDVLTLDAISYASEAVAEEAGKAFLVLAASLAGPEGTVLAAGAIYGEDEGSAVMAVLPAAGGLLSRANACIGPVTSLEAPSGRPPGSYRPSEPLPRGPNGEMISSSEYPHTQIGTSVSRKAGPYTQAREFGQNGQPIRDIDFTDHGRPGPRHTNPHQHQYHPNPTGGTPQRARVGEPFVP